MCAHSCALVLIFFPLQPGPVMRTVPGAGEPRMPAPRAAPLLRFVAASLEWAHRLPLAAASEPDWVWVKRSEQGTKRGEAWRSGWGRGGTPLLPLGRGGRRWSGVAAAGPGWPPPVSHPGQHCKPALMGFPNPTHRCRATGAPDRPGLSPGRDATGCDAGPARRLRRMEAFPAAFNCNSPRSAANKLGKAGEPQAEVTGHAGRRAEQQR